MARFVGSVPRVVAGLFVVAFSFWITLLVLEHTDRSGPAADRRGQASGPSASAPSEDAATLPARAARASSLRDLPKPAPGFPFDAVWDGIEGLNAQPLGPAAVPGRAVALSLVATRAEARHRLGLQFNGVPIDRAITMTLWFSAPPGAQIVVDVRDGQGKEGTPRNHGAAAFDLVERKILSSSGAIQGAAAESGPGGWVKVSGQTRSADGQVVIYIGLTGAKDAPPGGAPLHLVFGGIELSG